MLSTETFRVAEDFVQTARERGEDPARLLRALARDWVRSQHIESDFITLSDAVALGIKNGFGWSSGRTAGAWIGFWNNKHPDGDPLHIRRRYRQVHKGDLLRAFDTGIRSWHRKKKPPKE